MRALDGLPLQVGGPAAELVDAKDATEHEPDLVDEQLVRPHQSGWEPTADQLDWPPMTEHEAIEAVAAGTGIVVVPMSVARLHQRKDVVTRVVSDLEPTTIALVWAYQTAVVVHENRRAAKAQRYAEQNDEEV